MRLSLGRLEALALTAALGLLLAVGQSRAAVVQYYGIDVGVGPGGPHPNSAAQAAAFDAAVAATELIDWEAPTLPAGVTATGYGLDIGSGRVDTGPDAIIGYNTTTGGHWFYRVEPVFDAGIAGVRFGFATPINAFGAYYTGVGTANGSLHIVFDDGSSQDLLVAGNGNGGILFHGFTSTGAGVLLVDVGLTGVSGSRDIFGIDDIRVRSVPEPGTLTVLGMGLAAVVARRRQRR